MPSQTPNPEAGRRLRAVRERLRLSTREVERLSRILAEEKKNQEYAISHAWLTDIENGEFTPGIYKLYALSRIYRYGFDRVLELFNIDIGDLERERGRMPLPHTYLLREHAAGSQRSAEILQDANGVSDPDRTTMATPVLSELRALEASLFPEAGAGRAVYGYIGMKDFTLFPLIRPGSFVQIDSGQRRIESRGWSGIFERPIYFVELRDEYVCSWCEARENRLLLIPYPQPRNRVREVRFPADAEIVGRVTAVAMPIVRPRESASV
jgi:transcriptional regulator with XRE-family HTH domain